MQINTALILCAGFGKRLHPLTQEIPKPLLKIKEITLLEKTMSFIEKLKINKIMLNTFHLSNKIEEFVNKINTKIKIELINDGNEILDTGGGILNMVRNTSEKDFLVFNPDTIWEDNYIKYVQEMIDLYFKQKMENILLVVNKDSSFDERLNGDFNLVDGKLTRQNNRNFVYTGCQIINKNIFSKIQKKNFSMNEVWNEQIKNSKLFGYESKNKFLHISDLNIYNKILKN
ncbi:MAG: sugar phosphate nucleotidyltransferase [Candidatus Pelagibacter sp.]